MDRAKRMRMLLPTVWGVGCALGYSNPGDEYGLYALGSILGVWTIVLVDKIMLAPALLAGCAIMFGFAVLLERLRVSRRVWLIVWVVSGLGVYLSSLMMFPSVERAVAKNGSMAAYLALGSQLGVYLATIVSLVVGAVRMLVDVRRRAGTEASLAAISHPDR